MKYLIVNFLKTILFLEPKKDSKFALIDVRCFSPLIL